MRRFLKMEEKNTENQLLVEFAKTMWNQYFTDFDPALIESFVRQLPKFSGSLPAPWSFLGSGADSVAYGRRISGMDYCVTVPQSLFRDRLNADDGAWLNGVSRLVTRAQQMLFVESIPSLVPPMQVLKSPLALVMPAGQISGFTPRGSEFGLDNDERMADLMKQTYVCIEKLGLELNDVPQISWWHGVPFIHDWSDLRRR